MSKTFSKSTSRPSCACVHAANQLAVAVITLDPFLHDHWVVSGSGNEFAHVPNQLLSKMDATEICFNKISVCDIFVGPAIIT